MGHPLHYRGIPSVPRDWFLSPFPHLVGLSRSCNWFPDYNHFTKFKGYIVQEFTIICDNSRNYNIELEFLCRNEVKKLRSLFRLKVKRFDLVLTFFIKCGLFV